MALREMVTDHPEGWGMHLPVTVTGYRGSTQVSTSVPSVCCMAVRSHCQRVLYTLFQVRKHEKVRRSGHKHKRLADKGHGPCTLHHFIDDCKQLAILHDAADDLHKQRTADDLFTRETVEAALLLLTYIFLRMQ